MASSDWVSKELIALGARAANSPREVAAGGAQSRVADNWIKNKPTPNTSRLWYKDLMLALEFAGDLGLALPATAMAQELIELISAEEDR